MVAGIHGTRVTCNREEHSSAKSKGSRQKSNRGFVPKSLRIYKRAELESEISTEIIASERKSGVDGEI